MERTYQCLRAWWRLFDKAEEKLRSSSGEHIEVLESVTELNSFHHRLAFETLGSKRIDAFVKLANITRAALGHPRLFWPTPREHPARKDVVPEKQANYVRHALRQGWYRTLDHWASIADLLERNSPASRKEVKMLAACKRFSRVCGHYQTAVPSRSQLLDVETIPSDTPPSWPNWTELTGNFYANGLSIRFAFHHCLASLGWNISTLLSLDATKRPVRPHPTDDARWLLYGQKERGSSTHVAEGMWKSVGSPGSVVAELLRRSAPLREELQTRLEKAVQHYKEQRLRMTSDAEIDALKAIEWLKQGVKSVWLYVTRKTGITYLDEHTFRAGRKPNTSFMGELCDAVNSTLTRDEQVPAFPASDFRDIFALYHYKQSGRSLLVVKLALTHKRESTSLTYLQNNAFIAENRERFVRWMNALFATGLRSPYGIDHAAAALLAEAPTGEVGLCQIVRLDAYRDLRKSRLGLGCRNSKAPNKRVDPTFRSTGGKLCSVHRCTLCLENAVLLPESLDGLAMRVAEIEHIRMSMSIEAFAQSSFDEELHNARLALQLFPQEQAESAYEQWKARIRDGTHRVPSVDGRL